MATSYDVIVVGLGAMGSACTAHLARRGQRVLGLDIFPPVHDQGSSHGQTRIIREAYFEAPEYVPLVQRAYVLWRELEEETGRALLTITGGLNIGAPDSGLVSGALLSARRHNLPHELLMASEVTARFPGFRPEPEMAAVYEPRAGILQPEECVAAHLELAVRHGATLQHQEEVLRWRGDGGGVRVETTHGEYSAAHLVLTTGPWAPELLADLALPVRVERMIPMHFEPLRPELYAPDLCPVYIWQVPEGQYYGFPLLPGQGLKFGRHDQGELCTPRTIRRTVEASEIDVLRSVLRSYMPDAAGPVLRTVTCMYTNSADLHFIIDRDPRYPQVAYACGFSGHGFKFASVIGEILAEVTIDGRSSHAIDFLSAQRFSPVPQVNL